MPEYDDASYEDDNENFQQVRAHAKELEANLRRAEREMSVYKAGLNLNEKQVNALLAAHDGEFSPDALKETAAELGFVTATPPSDQAPEAPAAQPEPQAVPQEQVDAYQRIAQATATDHAPTPPASADQELADLRARLWAGENIPQAEAERVMAAAGFRNRGLYEPAPGEGGRMGVPNTKPLA